jgi:CBS domain-containing protein
MFFALRSFLVPEGSYEKPGREREMKARDVMNDRVVVATVGAKGGDVAIELLSGRYSGLPVVDTKGTVLGVVSELDLLKMIADRKDLRLMTVEEIMIKPAVCALDDEEVESVIAKMVKYNIRRLPVVQEDGKLVGIVSRTDILWGWQMQSGKEKLIAVV